MTDEWHETILGKLLTFSNGQSSPNRTKQGLHPVFGSNGLIGFAEETNAQADTIIVGRVGSYCGSLHYSKQICWVTDNAIRANAVEDNDPRFLYYLLENSNLHQWRGGSGQPLLNQRTLSCIPVSVPEPKLQVSIGEVLGSLDDKIELNRRTNRALEQMARAIFKAWFIDFEPVKAKAEGATSFSGMPQDVFDQLPDQLVETELGLTPKGWEVRPLGGVLDITMGQSPPSEFYNEVYEGLPFHQGVRDYGFRFPQHRVYCTLEARIAHEGDVLLSVRAPVGRINVADRRLVIGRGLAAARHPDGCSSYALYLLKHLFAEEDAVGDGTIYKAITKKFLFAMPVVCPPDGVVMEAERLLEPVDALLGNGVRELRVLAEMRDTLLPKLISGELRVSEDGEVNHGG